MLEKSFSSRAAGPFCLPKLGGKWRLVIDYRYLNSQIADEAFPLPVIEDLFLKQSKKRHLVQIRFGRWVSPNGFGA